VKAIELGLLLFIAPQPDVVGLPGDPVVPAGKRDVTGDLLSVADDRKAPGGVPLSSRSVNLVATYR
jgi:hypothetical protein